MKLVSYVFATVLFFTSSLVAQDQRAISAVTLAMQSVDAGDWDQAAKDIRPAGQIGQDIVDWYRLRASKGSFAEYQAFLDRRSDWPGLPLMRKRGEKSISKTANTQQVLDYFANHTPGTGVGSLRLMAALRAQGNKEAARAEAIRAWRELSLTQDEQAAFLRFYTETLATHHNARLDALLWRKRTKEAERMFSLVDNGHQALAKARIGLIKKLNGVDQLIAAIPAPLTGDAGLAYDRFAWRSSKRLTDSAIKLMISQSSSAQKLGQPEIWANKRRSLAREMMRSGNPKTAYKLASQHHLTKGSDYSDLEWLAGFIALTDLNDPATALRHFQNFRVAVFTPISLGRAGYWEGRAYEGLKQFENARVAFEFGGEYQTSFYGQLAAEKIGLAMNSAMTGREHYADFRQSKHANSTVLSAAMLFHHADRPLLFTRFTRHLAEILSPADLGSLAQLALNLDETYAALYMAKYAANNGTVLMRPYYPAPKIISGNLPVPRELAFAIARRESEFYTKAKSAVGARGLMQLMPKTGQAMADKIGLDFELSDLINKPPVNVKLGSAYLAELIEEFGPVYPLVAAGYNAGPSRPKRWSKQFGDPRAQSVDAIDWIEHIPFRETRNYVMRVMESLPVYRARLTGETAPFRMSKELKGR